MPKKVPEPEGKEAFNTRMAKRIKRYWKKQGYDVEVSLDKQFNIKTSTRGGLPREKLEVPQAR